MKRGVSMVKIAAVTLGCKVNQYDTSAMLELLENAGHTITDVAEEADIYLINTCTVTNIADRKSRQMIHRARKNNPEAKIIVCGCLAQRDAQGILAITGVQGVVGSKNRAAIVTIVEQILQGQRVNAVEDILSEHEFEKLTVKKSKEKVRAYIKICEGCNNFCSYCIIPYARGPVRSRSMQEIIAEAERLARAGVKEVVLTGIHIGSYGKDLPNGGLIDVIEVVAKTPGLNRIRLGSLEPSVLTEEFCERASAISILCPHFHVSLQSGARDVLKRMNRKYTPEEYAACIARLRRFWNNPAITTDVIAGFAGETEEEHLETMRFLRRMEFSKIHVFPYSERQGTKAAAMPNPVSPTERKRRASEIADLAEEMGQAYRSRFLNQRVTVLLEEKALDGQMIGHTERYLLVKVPQGAPNEMKTVRIQKLENETLIGQIEN